MTLHYEDEHVTLHHGDCLDVLRQLPDASVDAVATDPPYALEFMGRGWDKFTPLEFEQWCSQWAAECLRVLKPGGHLLAFGGSRTWHRLAAGIEDAGFEMRDSIAWVYASGFPKSLDVSKAIDKARDDRGDIVRVTTWLKQQAHQAGHNRATVDAHMGTSDMAGWWLTDLRHRCQCPTWEQWLKLRDLIGFDDSMDAEVWRLNGRKGTPGEAWGDREVIGYAADRRDDGTVIGLGHSGELNRATSATARAWQGWGTALKPAFEPIVVARKPLAGTVAANVTTHGVGALNIDGCRVDAGAERFGGGAKGSSGFVDGYQAGTGFVTATQGRWPSNLVLTHAATPDGADLCHNGCIDGCPVRELDRQSGVTNSTERRATGRPIFESSQSLKGGGHQIDKGDRGHNDSGGGSRFFPTFRYEPKAPTVERPCDGEVAHPTVKPLDLMRWLVRLVTPAGGIVLEPFAGSGTTAEACVVEGMRCIAVEREAAYLPLIVARLSKPIALDLFGGVG